MRAMVLEEVLQPLKLKDVSKPQISSTEVLIAVHVCAVCRTDLHIVDGELPHPKLPLIPGHQVVGHIVEMGQSVKGCSIGDRVGVPWLAKTCGTCPYCLEGKENLCDNALFTGYTKDGGFAEFVAAESSYIIPIPSEYIDLHAAPLLCAGLIGYRALRATGSAKKIGFYGFGVSAHILVQIATFQKKEIFAFTKQGDLEGQEFAKSLGAKWAGHSLEEPPTQLDAAIIFAPVGALIPQALKHVKKGGLVVSAGIHMSDIPSFPYHLLWEERMVTSVANLDRKDAEEFFKIAANTLIQTKVNVYPLEEANVALDDMRAGKLEGAAVLQITL